MKVHYALAAMAASASALIAPAAMPRALVARPAPTADATVLEVPRPRPLFYYVLRNGSCGWIASPTVRLHPRAEAPRATLVSVAELVFLQRKKSQEGVGFKPQSLRRRGFEPHRMQYSSREPIGATVARQIPVLKVTRSNHVSVIGLTVPTRAGLPTKHEEGEAPAQPGKHAKVQEGRPPSRGGGGKKKTMSRKKLTLKAQAAVEKGREATFMSKLVPRDGRRARGRAGSRASYKAAGGVSRALCPVMPRRARHLVV